MAMDCQEAGKRQYFGNVNQTASGDYDGDGQSNLQEYLNHTDPTVAQTPTITSWPQSQTVYANSSIELTVVPLFDTHKLSLSMETKRPIHQRWH